MLWSKKRIKGHQHFFLELILNFLQDYFFEVPEIYEGTIEIKSVADPGSRAKICVYSRFIHWSCWRLCRNERESPNYSKWITRWKNWYYKMDWGSAYINFRVSIPCRNTKSLIDQDNKRIDIILTEENLSKAIGRRGQNVD